MDGSLSLRGKTITVSLQRELVTLPLLIHFPNHISFKHLQLKYINSFILQISFEHLSCVQQ